MVPGVYTVSATGQLNMKSFYSSYGMPWVQAAAPGGDSRQKTTAMPDGRVLSTYPAALIPDLLASGFNPNRVFKVCDEDGGACGFYVTFQGTSMASPHVAGVAALIASRFGHQDAETMTQLLNAATNQIPCPANPYGTYPGPDGKPAHCSGTLAYNSFYGHGQIDALKAVTGGSGHND